MIIVRLACEGTKLGPRMGVGVCLESLAPGASLFYFFFSVDCSKYSLFMLVSHNYERAGTSAFFIFKGNTYNTYYVSSSGTTNNNTKMRTVQITDTSLIISAGYQGNNSSDNKVLVPYELYGVL